jgi:hypothetical protein
MKLHSDCAGKTFFKNRAVISEETLKWLLKECIKEL